jgi:hypothetical protein
MGSKGGEVRVISYKQFCAEERKHPLRQYEIPVSHSISLAIPTLRLGIPGYARFASPAERAPDKPLRQYPPDRWWVFSAVDSHLLLYVQCASFPMGPDCTFDVVTLEENESPMSTVRERLEEIEALMDEVAPAFFRAEPGAPALRSRLLHLLHQHLSEALLPQYRVLAPDFFAWLKS